MKLINKPKPIINFDELNRTIEDIEFILSEFNIEEQELIIKLLSSRLFKKRQDTTQSDLMNKTLERMPFNKILSKLTKAEREGD